jgi:hypothetical protein
VNDESGATPALIRNVPMRNETHTFVIENASTFRSVRSTHSITPPASRNTIPPSRLMVESTLRPT